MNRMTPSEETFALYKDLWQLEVWLRRLVYVELKAKYGPAMAGQFHKAKTILQNDQAFHHMPTTEGQLISYILLPGLMVLIDAHWSIFEDYLLPRKQWDARMEEIVQIRNRVAHFRHGHADDGPRVRQMLRDLDPKMWRLCVSLSTVNVMMRPTVDPVVAAFVHMEDLPYVEVRPNEWARCGTKEPHAAMAFQLDVIKRPWANLAPSACDEEGYIYQAYFYARGGRHIQVERVLERMNWLSDDILLLGLGGLSDSLTLLLPAKLGLVRLKEVIEYTHELVLSEMRHGPSPKSADALEALALSMPEHVLQPYDPLIGTSHDMKYSIFAA